MTPETAHRSSRHSPSSPASSSARTWPEAGAGMHAGARPPADRGCAGRGQTTLAHALARAIGLKFQRIQFTSDLLPADVLGASHHDRDSGFRFHPGPIFAQCVLADEVNRATLRTQSALLEAMERSRSPWMESHPCRGRFRHRHAKPFNPGGHFPSPSRSSTASSCALPWDTPDRGRTRAAHR